MFSIRISFYKKKSHLVKMYNLEVKETSIFHKK